MGRLFDDRSVDPDGARLAPDGRRIEQARGSEMVGVQQVHRLLGHQDLARPGERGDAGGGVGRVAENLAILFDHRPDADAHLDRDRGAAVRALHIDGGLVGSVRRRKGAHHAIAAGTDEAAAGKPRGLDHRSNRPRGQALCLGVALEFIEPDAAADVREQDGEDRRRREAHGRSFCPDPSGRGQGGFRPAACGPPERPIAQPRRCRCRRARAPHP